MQAIAKGLPFETRDNGAEIFINVPNGYQLIQIIPEAQTGGLMMCVLVPGRPRRILPETAELLALMWESEAEDINQPQEHETPNDVRMAVQSAKQFRMCANQLRGAVTEIPEVHVVIGQGGESDGSLLARAGLSIEAVFTDPEEASRYESTGDMETYALELNIPRGG